MRNLTPEEIDRIVEAVKEVMPIPHILNRIDDKAHILHLLRTALATITLDQPKQIDLNEVENIVSIFHRDTHAIIRARIGYTINDLTP